MDNIQYCQDSGSRVSGRGLAEVIQHDAADLRRSSLIQRRTDAQAADIRVERVSMDVNGVQQREELGRLILPSTKVADAQPAPITGREDATPNLANNSAYTDTSAQAAAPVITTKPAEAAYTPAMRPSAQPPAPAVITAQQPTQVPVQITTPKTRIVMSSDRMGRHRLSVDKFSVSETVVILGYIDNEDSVIVEPPVTTAGAELTDVITIARGDQSFNVVYYGFTAEMQMDGHQMLLVVLIRV